MDAEIKRSTIRKLTFRIIAFTGLLYFFNWLDRSNIGFAALQMNKELGFSPAVYGLGAGIFFIGYAIFEAPSNLILHRVGARIWIARIMVTWGLTCCACAAIQNATSLYILRFLLGVAEAGFTPGILLYLSSWFPRRHRGRAYALLFATPLLAPIFGGPLSGWLMTVTHQAGGLSGWRWMFLIEGLPSVVLGVATFFYLKSGPTEASWLTEAERDWLAGELAQDEEVAAGHLHGSVGAFLGDLRLWAMVATYFFWAMSGYALVFWLPQMVANFTKMTPFQIGLVSALPFICAITGLILMGRRTDRTGERKWSIVSFAVLTALALLGSAYSPTPWIGFGLLCVAAFFIWGQQAVFWTLPTTYLGGISAAAGIALVNTGAALGGFVSPPAIGFIREATGSYQMALLAISATSLVVAVIVGAMKIERLKSAP